MYHDVMIPEEDQWAFRMVRSQLAILYYRSLSAFDEQIKLTRHLGNPGDNSRGLVQLYNCTTPHINNIGRTGIESALHHFSNRSHVGLPHSVAAVHYA